MDRQDLRLAVLIDADNAPRTALRDIMAEVAVYGNPTIKRIYGDWTTPNMGTWKPLLLEHAITPIQQYSYTTGKNATDSAMIIDAMDLLYSGNLDGFCIVSSDSDFTRLAARLREAGKLVIGITEFEPMDYQDADGNWIGFDADMAKLVAEKLGVEPVFTVINWDNKVFELNGKGIDVVWNGMTITTAAQEAMECTNAYCNNAQVIVTK